MGNLKEIKSGEKFNNLTIIKELPSEIYKNGQIKRLVLCKCECGNEVIAPLKSVKSGRTKSCGCLMQTYLSSPHPNRMVKIEVGERYGKLTIIKEVEPRIKHNGKIERMFLCRCDCGEEIVAPLTLMRQGRKQSCGCIRFPIKSKSSKPTHRPELRKENPRLYRIWNGMRGRCFNVKNTNYYLYGERGITICDDWLYFENFYDWAISNGYSDTLTIDRINPNENYEPSNCRWVDLITQGNNRRNNTLITIHGKTKTLSEWCREKGISIHVVVARIKSGWDVERLFEPVKR